jgi:hypothetical protein
MKIPAFNDLINENSFAEDSYFGKVLVPSGYLFTKPICKLFNKKFSDFSRLNATRNLISILPKQEVEYIIEVLGSYKGDPTFQGSFIHPMLIENFLVWVQTRCLRGSETNEKTHVDKIVSLIGDCSVEVETPVGRCDIVTNNFVIEVKRSEDWKHALGQVISYSYFLNKYPVISLFGDIPNECYLVCNHQNVLVTSPENIVSVLRQHMRCL